MTDFAKCFELLTGNPPFAWQAKLYKKFLANEIPTACDIPTGLGKTSVIVIWLLALSTKLLENPKENKIPRRLVYVVDRRVIVDQATDEAEKILCKILQLKDSEDEIGNIYKTFRDNSFLEKNDKKIIALSTLRGEFADNREWCLDPSRPAIIVGTIDMIGSRLLFSAYGGVGESYKALQAGLLGQDALIVVDEAHLSLAFVEMLKSLPDFVNRKKTVKPFEVMFLSATFNDKDGIPDKILSLEKDAPEDLINEVSKSRLEAEKRIEWETFIVSEDEEKQAKKEKKSPYYFQAKKMVEAAIRYKDSSASVLIFGKQVDLVKEIKTQMLEQIDESRVLLMVGGMRGFERNQLVKNPIFKMFDPKRNRNEQDKSYFLVATSCAEVGVNLDADFAVCDLTSAGSFIQRLGRINRFGNTSAVVSIVHNDNLDQEKEPAIETQKTLKALENGENLNASPLALREIEFPENCNPPKPVCPSLDSARIDDWSMTSLKQNDFRRPLVSYWLRGVTENKTSETSLCWRADLNLANRDKRKVATVKTVRVKSRECARESTSRAIRTILAVAKVEELSKQKAVVITSANDYEVCTFEDLAKLDEKDELFGKLKFATVVLPCEVGGLEAGIAVDDSAKLKPVDDVVSPEEWQRILFTETDNGVRAEIIGGETESFDEENIKDVIRKFAGKDKRCVRQIKMNLPSQTEETDEEEPAKKRVLVYFINKKSPEGYLPNEAESDDETEGETSSIDLREISVDEHNQDVAKYAEQLARKLCLSAEFVEALSIAGAWHDKGKARKCWQNAVGNFEFPEKILAKSNQAWFGHKYNNYYRHEFGSLVEVEEDKDLSKHPNCDLILHLIATHHGYARPHFPERAFDQENPNGLNRETAERAMLRFANLQIKYGWWQLAYLEAILKAADALASRAEARGEKI